MCSGTLWLGNAAYLYLSVSFIQMLKALMPVAVFGVGCGLGTESYNNNTMLNMVVVTIGVAIASYGEINFVVLGVLLQLAAVMTESSRLTLVLPFILCEHACACMHQVHTWMLMLASLHVHEMLSKRPW